jgi:WD40 repeat protein
MFMPDCNYLLISSLNNQLQVINLLTEDEVVKYTGNVNSKHLVDVAIFDKNERKYLLTGSEDDSIGLWDIEKGGDCKKVITGTSGQTINSLASSRDGVIAYSGFPDNENNLTLFSLGIN